jgi:hypothetical protein
VTRKGKACISCPQAHTLRLTQEQEARFWQAAARLSEEGIRPTRERVAQEAGLGLNRAQVFLRTQADELPVAARPRQAEQQERLRRLEEACGHLEAQGVPVTIERLARTAHVRKETVADFLHERKRGSSRRQVSRCMGASKEERTQERQERLEKAFGHLSAQSATVSATSLARTARVGKESAIAFLQARKEESHAAAAQAR